ncbi:hypothetical protein Herbaro_05950 [Herbaspirillum sp. WKF16]|uniref:hypothetical protein n=1 Tax=Herbaspirillum sp. WKF16 TaxID=3028312 RepID=UPI0023A9B358|nr:hypothetical protein [Herbaspirillum sp. WKF16]WDZ97330.1 hypothetical protein Herbaro_05950 [Herbaspirillum sp. WKF16]
MDVKRALRAFFLKRVLLRLTERPAPNRIPMSGPRAEERNYYVVRLKWVEPERDMLVSSMHENTVVGLELLGDSYQVQVSTTLEDAAAAGFDVDFYYRRYEFSSKNPVAFELNSLFGIYQLQAAKHDFSQWLFNKKSLVAVERYALLRYMVNLTVQQREVVFNPVALAGREDERAVFHPSFQRHVAYYSFILDSLLADGLLSKDDFSYRVLPKALGALNAYEEEARRHKSALRLQFLFGLFGIAASIGAVIQAWPIAEALYKRFSE